MHRRLEPLKNVISKYLQKKGLHRQVEIALALEEFVKIARQIWPEEIVEQMRPAYIKDGFLYVAVLNSVLGQEIKIRETLLVSELKRRLGKNIIKGIKVIL